MATTTQVPQAEFGKWRSFFWPIHAFELKKLLPMLLLCFFILFNYTILRDTKDTLVVTAAGGGAEVIPFLKVWGTVPMALIYAIVYSKMSNKLSKPALFYASVIPFILFFILFTTVLYPYRDILHPHALADRLQEAAPRLHGLIAVMRNWTYSLFYIMAELWGSVALSLLFWGFANDITKVSESKRFYALFGMGGNFALILSGQAIILASDIRSKVPIGQDPWQVSLNILMTMVVGAGLIIMGIYWWINRYVLTDPRFYDPSEKAKMKKEKPKMSLGESFKFLIKSKYIGCLAILVLGYGVAINLVEVTWKAQLKLQFPNANDYSTFMGGFSQCTGIVTILMMLFVGGNLIRRKGWTFAALFTPAVLLASGVLFFAFILLRDKMEAPIAALGTTPLMLAVLFGTIQNIMSKSSKYSLFDPTKEMAYIPLDQESKVKGKAAIDVVGARLGKSGGSIIQQALIIAFGIAGMTPYIGIILFGIITAWIFAAKSLGTQFNALMTKKAEDKKEAAAASVATLLPEGQAKEPATTT